jgi:hypothetical protein
LELAEVRERIGRFDPGSLCYPWQNPDPSVDRLCIEIQALIKREETNHTSRPEIFRQIWNLADTGEFPDIALPSRATIPYLTEPWYC